MSSRLRPLVVVGAGGFGREVLDVIDALNSVTPSFRLMGVVDDLPTVENLSRLRRRKVAYLGTTQAFLNNGRHPGEPGYVVGIGAPKVRKRVAEAFDDAALEAVTLIHPSVTRGFDVQIDAGSVVCSGARLTTNITLGRHVHLNLNVTVGHDSVIWDYATVNPLAAVSGDCTIQGEVLIGSGAVVLNGLTVGQSAMVGGSACVVRDVEKDSVVVGVPARRIR